jgi:hypothetical protein
VTTKLRHDRICERLSDESGRFAQWNLLVRDWVLFPTNRVLEIEKLFWKFVDLSLQAHSLQVIWADLRANENGIVELNQLLPQRLDLAPKWSSQLKIILEYMRLIMKLFEGMQNIYSRRFQPQKGDAQKF